MLRIGGRAVKERFHITNRQKFRIAMRPVAFVLCVAVFVIAATADPAAEPTSVPSTATKPTTKSATGAATKPAEKDMIRLNFPTNLEVKVLVDYVSKRLGMNILYDDSIVRKRVTISSPAKIPKDSLLGLFQSVLKMAGLVLVDDEQPGWKRIVRDKDMLSVTAGMEKDLAKLATAKATTAITQIFHLRHVTPRAVEQTIRPFLSKPGGNSFSIAERNLVIISDYAGNLRRITKLIEMLDAPGKKASVCFVPVKHLDATLLARQVTALLREKDQVAAGAGKSVRRRLTLTPEPRTNQIIVISAEGADVGALEFIRALDVPSDAERRSYRFKYVSPERIDKLAKDFIGLDQTKSRYKSIIDKESGLLIVMAPPKIHDYIKSIASELDVAGAETESSNVRFYKLTNTTAANVLATIRALEVGEQGLAGIESSLSSSSQKPSSESFTGPNKPPPPVGKELPKPPSYREAAATDDKTEAGKSGSSVVTTRTAGAMVTVDTNTNTLIVIAPPRVQRIYKQLISMLDKRRPQVMVEITLVTLDTSDNFSLGVELSRAGKACKDDSQYLAFGSFGLSTIDMVTGGLALSPGTGFNGMLVGPDQINIIVRALATSGHAKVIAAPKMLVNDNATATLSSVAESPFTSVNASQTVSTTSFAGYASAGTTIAVTPHISEGDHLQLQYSVTLSSFSGEGAAGIPPPRQTNTLDSEITVPDGYTVIVGGLTRKDFSKSVSKIPWLGDIPILKYLVSSRTRGDAQSTLFAFVRPVILRDDQFEDLKYLSDRELKLADMPPNFPRSAPLIMQ